ncbi:MAG: hypothetical protein ACREQ4_10830, partial [Candidatus Binataceae bacterium]
MSPKCKFCQYLRPRTAQFCPRCGYPVIRVSGPIKWLRIRNAQARASLEAVKAWSEARMDADKQNVTQHLAFRKSQIATLATERQAEYALSSQRRLHELAVKDLHAREALVMRLSE